MALLQRGRARSARRRARVGSSVAAVAVVLATPPAGARPDAPKPNAREGRGKIRVWRDPCSQRHVLPCIRQAARRHRVSYTLLVRRARCESTLNPYAVNGVHAGLFQFRVAAPSTWATTPYGRHSAYSAKWASLAAAWMQRVGRGGEWACQ